MRRTLSFGGYAALGVVLVACGGSPVVGHGSTPGQGDHDAGVLDAAGVPPGEASRTGDASPPGDSSGPGESSPSGDGAQSTGEADSSSSECGAATFCDGFEEDTPGAAPSGWTVVMGCDPNTVDGPVDGGGLLVGVDGSQHHGGTRSVRVVGGDSCGFYLVQTAALAGSGADVYARLWARFSGGPTQNHNGFLSMATASGDHLRLGFQDDVLAWNAQKSDATLPDMDPQGTTTSAATPVDAWVCMEFHVASSDTIEFWLGGQAVSGLSYAGGNVQGVSDQWSRGAPSPILPVSLGLGWLGLNDQRTVWFDDVALGPARIGCE
jgi:hypothetical protein